MTIQLPALPRGTRVRMRKVFAATEPLKPAFGTSRPIDRPGDHWAVEIEGLPRDAACGAEFMADLVKGPRLAVRIPQPTTDTGAVGSPKVDGSSPSGSILPLKGLTPGAAIKKGWFLSVITAGQRTTYQATETQVVAANGRVRLPVWPMLSVAHASNDIAEVGEPWIEGYLTEGGEHDVLFRSVTPGTFVIEEAP